MCDGANWGGIYTGTEMKLNEVTEYVSLPVLAPVINCEIFANEKKWNSLPKDMQAIVQNACDALSAESLAYITSMDFDALQKFKVEGGKVSYLNDESISLLKKAAIETIDELSEKDPKYSKQVGDLLKEHLKKTI